MKNKSKRKNKKQNDFIPKRKSKFKQSTIDLESAIRENQTFIFRGVEYKLKNLTCTRDFNDFPKLDIQFVPCLPEIVEKHSENS